MKTRPKAIEMLILQAEADADLTLSAIQDSTDQEGQIIKSLFESLPIIPQEVQQNN